jgi:hypothetical protein
VAWNKSVSPVQIYGEQLIKRHSLKLLPGSFLVPTLIWYSSENICP